MNTRLLMYLIYSLVLLISTYSCRVPDVDENDRDIVGIWQLRKEYNGGYEGKSFREFPLSCCEKMTTLKIMSDHKFIESSYYGVFGMGGQCMRNKKQSKGRWDKTTDGKYHFCYDGTNYVSSIKSSGIFNEGNLEVTLSYHDPDEGQDTVLKLVYQRVK